MSARCVIIPVLLLALPACGPGITPDFRSPEPAARNAAIVRAAAGEDRGSLHDLVRMLDSDDPATRVLAIQALERLTGERLGYDPGGTPEQRRQAADRWQGWVKEHAPEPPPNG